MKYVSLFNGFCPAFARGADPVSGGALLASSAINAGAGLFGSFGSALSQQEINERNLAAQREENQKDRDFNAAEAEKQRQWQAAEWSRQFGMQSAEWYDQQREMQRLTRQNFMFEADYNDPVNQVKRMASAGYNPSALLSGGNGMVAAATGNMMNQGSVSVPSGGTVSGSAASAHSGQLPPQQNPWNLSSIGSFIKDISDSYVANAKLRPEIDNLKSDLISKYLTQEGQRLYNGLNQFELIIKGMTKKAIVGNAFQEWRNNILSEYLNLAITGNYDEDTLLKSAQRWLTTLKSNVTQEEYNQAVFTTVHQLEGWQNMLANDKARRASMYASVNQSYAQAGLFIAETKTTDELRTWLVANERNKEAIGYLQRQLLSNEVVVSNVTLGQRSKTELTELGQRMLQANIMTADQYTQLQKAVKENNTYYLRLFIDLLGDVLQSGATVYGLRGIGKGLGTTRVQTQPIWTVTPPQFGPNFKP